MTTPIILYLRASQHRRHLSPAKPPVPQHLHVPHHRQISHHGHVRLLISISFLPRLSPPPLSFSPGFHFFNSIIFYWSTPQTPSLVSTCCYCKLARHFLLYRVLIQHTRHILQSTVDPSLFYLYSAFPNLFVRSFDFLLLLFLFTTSLASLIASLSVSSSPAAKTSSRFH